MPFLLVTLPSLHCWKETKLNVAVHLPCSTVKMKNAWLKTTSSICSYKYRIKYKPLVVLFSGLLAVAPQQLYKDPNNDLKCKIDHCTRHIYIIDLLLNRTTIIAGSNKNNNCCQLHQSLPAWVPGSLEFLKRNFHILTQEHFPED